MSWISLADDDDVHVDPIESMRQAHGASNLTQPQS